MGESLADGVAQAQGADPASVLAVVKTSYGRLIDDRDLLLVLMHANCAASEPLIREAIRACYAKQVEYVRGASGASDEEIQQFIANGLLANALLAIDGRDVDAPWAHSAEGLRGPLTAPAANHPGSTAMRSALFFGSRVSG
ncbi:hypothetical protein [Streptomyces sp. NPDC058486]|uniref:hypothetical protein n=1 Tax=unclassified Streptomyces TaxID=2593676 RepID=UPI00365A4716